MLDVDVWDGAASLAAIYQYVTELLVRANVTKQVAEALEARHLLAELGDAFKQAAVQLAITSSPRSQGATDQIEQRRLSVRA